MTAMRPDHAREVRNCLTDPVALCNALGLSKGAKRQRTGLIVCCPAHGELHPSCSVTRGPDGTVRVVCFACGFTGDALSLVAQVRGLSLRGDGFRETLVTAAELSGHHGLADEIRSGRLYPERQPVARPAPLPAVDYPEQAEVIQLWRSCRPVCTDFVALEYLQGRSLDPERVDATGVARVMGPRTKLPRWARYRGGADQSRSWWELGHRLLLPMFDHAGALRSVRAWRITDGDTPKRLPPSGKRSTGLVMANRPAWLMLSGRASPLKLVIVEGEPDTLSWSVSTDFAVIGIISGSWSGDFTDAIPRGTEVVLRTHVDEAGERYASYILESIGERCAVRVA